MSNSCRKRGQPLEYLGVLGVVGRVELGDDLSLCTRLDEDDPPAPTGTALMVDPIEQPPYHLGMICQLGGAAFQEHGVVPDAVALGDAFTDADCAESRGVVQRDRRAVLGDDGCLQGP